MGGGLLRAGARAISRTRPPDARSLDESIAGRLAIGGLNGAFGDGLHARRSALATPMTIRRAGRDVAVAPDALANAFADATPRLAVFVHGLCETDDAWRFGAERHPPYGEQLRTDHGFTPLHLRYNTGRHVSENGRELATVLHELVGSWPVEVQEIALIGHSMGGLVSRSACHYSDGHWWPSTVRHVFTLGTPHTGAPLEQAATVATAALGRLRRPVASRVRSAAAVPGSRISVVAISSTRTGPTRTRRRSSSKRGRRSRSWRVLTITSCAPPCPPMRMPRPGASSATCSCCARARGASAGAASACGSRSSTTTMSAGRTTSICSVTPQSTRRSARGWPDGRRLRSGSTPASSGGCGCGPRVGAPPRGSGWARGCGGPGGRAAAGLRVGARVRGSGWARGCGGPGGRAAA